jgi:8-oxo-dGTP pyrophosphatase MutT (NUDIX family)
MEKPEWFYRQSGVIPYRLRQGEVEVLLITSRGQRRWVIPKGIVEPDWSPADSAAREAWEEAGLRGRLQPAAAGSFAYAKWGGECNVEVFLLQVEQEADLWPEAGLRRRQWLSIAEAAGRVAEPGLRRLLEQLPDLLDPTGCPLGESEEERR